MDAQRDLDEDLIKAAFEGRLGDIADLVGRGASFGENLFGETAMIAAAKGGSSEAIEKLAQLGADAGAANRLGLTPVMMAALSQTHGVGPQLESQFAAIRTLVKLGASVDARQSDAFPAGDWNGEDGEDEDEARAGGRHMGLLSSSEVAAQRDGDTALIGAIAQREEGLGEPSPVVRALLRAGADPNLANREGVTPLMVAAYKGDWPSMDALLEAGSRLEDRDARGFSALMHALAFDNDMVAIALLKAGADPLAADVSGLSCRMLMERWNAGPELVQAMGEAEALMDARELRASLPEAPKSKARLPRV